MEAEDVLTALRAECPLRLPGVMHCRQYTHVHQGDGVPRCYRREDGVPVGAAPTAAQARLDAMVGRPSVALAAPSAEGDPCP